jgi:hypothetical protein
VDTHIVIAAEGSTLLAWAAIRYGASVVGGINIAELLFVNFYIYIFIEQRLWADTAMNFLPAAMLNSCTPA